VVLRTRLHHETQRRTRPGAKRPRKDPGPSASGMLPMLSQERGSAQSDRRAAGLKALCIMFALSLSDLPCACRPLSWLAGMPVNATLSQKLWDNRSTITGDSLRARGCNHAVRPTLRACSATHVPQVALLPQACLSQTLPRIAIILIWGYSFRIRNAWAVRPYPDARMAHRRSY
jgi:hypothetical protein